MAGDWIKMRGNLWDDPRVACLCDATDQSEAAIVGALYWLWATADQHTEDGLMPGLSFRQIDRKTGIQGLAEALADIGWIEQENGGIRITRFDEHNGSSAKRRAQEAKRKAGIRNVSATDADKTGTDDGSDAELEKEIEKEKKKTPPKPPKGDWPRFDDFWSAYPRKADKAKALKAWNKIKPDDRLVGCMLRSLMAWAKSEQWKKDGGQYIPLATTWLNGARWEDELPNPPPPAGGGAPRLKEFRP